MGGVGSQLFAQIVKSRQAQILFFFCFVIINIYLYYISGQRRQFSQESKKFDHHVEQDKRRQLPMEAEDLIDKRKINLNMDLHVSAGILEINVIIPFTDVEEKTDFQKKFKVCLESMLNYTSIPVAFHIVGDVKSYAIAEKILKDFQSQTTDKKDKLHRMVHQDVSALASRLETVIKTMHETFSYKPGDYYSHALFFLSLALHRVLPNTMDRVIMLDADLKFNADIKDLFAHFSLFQPSNVIGIAPELQPVYRHSFQMYRDQHKGTPIGEPFPTGQQGYNSGVLLLSLQRMRQSKLYNDLLNADRVEALAKKYFFKGHLGDQDFFTLISMEHKDFFYTLPCSWNRQLCQWWKDKGYEDVFDQYHNCTGPIYIYHGNCNTPIPAH